MEFDDVFQYIGHIGLYQVLLYFMLGSFNIFSGLQALIPNFYIPRVDHWCFVDRLQNFSHNTQKYVAIPYQEGEPGEYDGCKMYNIAYDNVTDMDILSWDRQSMKNTSTVDCTNWVYDQTEFVSTITSKFDLVCGKAWMAELSSTIFMAGALVGSFISGWISDRLGRKPTMIVSGCLLFVFTLVQAFAPNYPAFVVFRFVCSFLDANTFLSAFTLTMEIMGPRFHVMLGTLYQIFFSVGIMLVTGMSYVIRDVDKLFFVSALPLLYIIPMIWVVPESPRWQATRGEYDKAEKTLRYIAQVNRVEFPNPYDWTKEDSKKNVTQTGKCLDICNSSILCGRLVLVFFNWFTVSLVYYGVSFSAGSFGDVFLNTFLSALIEVPANIICWLCLERVGRRWPNGASLLVTGVFCLACVPVILTRPDMGSLLTGLSTVGKGAVTFGFTSMCMYNAELFPTPVRQLALGLSLLFSRIGAMASPFLGRTLEEFWKPMPSVIFGALAVFTGCMVFLLPETKGRPLPDSIEEAEHASRKKKKNIFNNEQQIEAWDLPPQKYVKNGDIYGNDNIAFGDEEDRNEENMADMIDLTRF